MRLIFENQKQDFEILEAETDRAREAAGDNKEELLRIEQEYQDKRAQIISRSRILPAELISPQLLEENLQKIGASAEESQNLFDSLTTSVNNYESELQLLIDVENNRVALLKAQNAQILNDVSLTEEEIS